MRDRRLPSTLLAMLCVPLLGILSGTALADDAVLTLDDPVFDPWRTDAPVPLVVELTSLPAGTASLRVLPADGTSIDLPPPTVPGPLSLAGWLPDAWHLPAGGTAIEVQARSAEGEVLASSKTTLTVRSAADSLATLAGEIEETSEVAKQAGLLGEAAQLALDLGLSGEADEYAARLRRLAPRLAALDGATARRIAISRAMIEAQIQRSYVDADPVHRRAAIDRIDRLRTAAEDDPDLAARCAILLGEAAVERWHETPRGAERRRLLDRARELARAARTGERSPRTILEAELLWARVAIARGWRTESEETLGRLSNGDPRRAIATETLRRQVAQSTATPDTAATEATVDRAQQAIEHLRRHAGSLRVDAGLLRSLRPWLEGEIDRAAKSGDGAATWALIEAARPRDPRAPRPSAAELVALSQRWGKEVACFAAVALEEAVISIRAQGGVVSVSRIEVARGSVRERLRALLRSRGEDSGAIEWFSERLVAPHPEPWAPQIAFAPLGTLRSLPFDALTQGRFPLGSSHTTWSVPAAAAISPEFARTIGDRPVLAVVDPFFDKDRDGEPDRPRLPATVGEVEPWRGAEAGDLLFRGVEATEARVTEAAAAMGLIHLGCHGEHARHRPERSALLLAPGGGTDGRLLASEIAALDLRSCALLCLSGCETGLTRAGGEDDLAGFPRAVLTAGAGALLGSLWPVDDETAGAFFRNFHVELRDSGDPRQALRQARRKSRQTAGTRSPRHWAPWVLLENFPTAVDTEKRGE